MARIYHNTGTSGRDFSNLQLSKNHATAESAWFRIEGTNSVVLNKEQVEDLIEQLSIIIGLSKKSLAPLPMIEGNVE